MQVGGDPAPRSQLGGAGGVIGDGFRASLAADEDGQEAGCHRQSRRRQNTLRVLQLKLTGGELNISRREKEKSEKEEKVALAASTESTNRKKSVCFYYY